MTTTPPVNPNILIVKLSAIGDIVHTLPVLNTLRNVYPQATISWAAHPGVAGILKNHPQLDNLILIPRRVRNWHTLKESVSDLRRHTFDYVIDFQGLTKSGLWSAASGGKNIIGFSGKESREINRLFMGKTINASKRYDNILDINLALLQALDIPESSFSHKAVIVPTSEDHAYINRWIDNNNVNQNARFLIIDPFAGWETKTWSEEYWIRLARLAAEQHELQPLIIWGPNEEDKAKNLADKMLAQTKVQTIVAPQTSLLQLSALYMELGHCMVAGDTGPMHIAAALGIPVVAIFGPSCSTRNAPCFEGAVFAILHDKTLPCTGTYNRVCKHGHRASECMGTITPEMVMDKLSTLLCPERL